MKQTALTKNASVATIGSNRPQSNKRPPIPAALLPFTEPLLLPGERIDQYNAISCAMIDDIQPSSNIEWLWSLDLIELTWETLRYRRLKAEALAQHRQYAIETLLAKVDSQGLPASAWPAVIDHAQRNAAEWNSDPHAAAEIEAYLKRRGIDEAMINAEVYVQAQAAFSMFDGLLQGARSRIMSLLREMSIRRDFARRARLASEKAI